MDFVLACSFLGLCLKDSKKRTKSLPWRVSYKGCTEFHGHSGTHLKLHGRQYIWSSMTFLWYKYGIRYLIPIQLLPHRKKVWSSQMKRSYTNITVSLKILIICWGAERRGKKSHLLKQFKIKQEYFSSRWSMKSERKYLIAWRTECWTPGSQETRGPCSTEGVALCHSKHVGCHYFHGLPQLGLRNPWASSLVTANDPRSHSIMFAAVNFSDAFFCLLWSATVKDCTHGWSSHLVLGFHLSGHYSLASHKKEKQRAQCCSPYREEELHSTTKELGPRDCYLFTQTSAQEAAFRGKTRGHWCVKFIYGHKKITCQTTCCLQCH